MQNLRATLQGLQPLRGRLLVVAMTIAIIFLYYDGQATRTSLQELKSASFNQQSKLEVDLRNLENDLVTLGDVVRETESKLRQEIRLRAEEQTKRLAATKASLQEEIGQNKTAIVSVETKLLEELAKTNANIESLTATQNRIASNVGKGLVTLDERLDKMAKLASDLEVSVGAAHNRIFQVEQRLEDFGEIQQEVHQSRLNNNERAKSTAREVIREFDERMAGHEWAAREGIWVGIDKQLTFLRYLALNVNNGVTEDEFLERVRRLVKYLETSNFSSKDLEHWSKTLQDIFLSVFPKG